ncbi:hypothetical protein NDU88_006570 [Pleurodeles waltl]|uniref:Uncharacterized protein n=1 Tax=Pleurodeles waltl TaxID=8319 RepID=A0AAV7NS86_PLEWA|nr:hypothetical protein NDU88_006570 [Pleurodeles waltl]
MRTALTAPSAKSGGHPWSAPRSSPSSIVVCLHPANLCTVTRPDGRRCALPGSPLCKSHIVGLLHSLLLFSPALSSSRRSYEGGDSLRSLLHSQLASGRTSPLMMYARAEQSPEDPRDRRCSGSVGANM